MKDRVGLWPLDHHHPTFVDGARVADRAPSALQEAKVILRKTFRFEASHVLPKHPGKCSRLHGHSWVLHIGVSGRINRDTGFVMDYSEISNRCDSLVKELDHHHLNDFINYPSSENVALWVGGQLATVKFPWAFIAIEETCTSYCQLTRKEYDAGDYYATPDGK